MEEYTGKLFGLSMEPNKAYSYDLDTDIHLTMFSLGETLPANPKRTVVKLTVNDTTFTVCSFLPGKVENQSVDLHLLDGDSISFEVVGNCPVTALGNEIYRNFPDEDDMDDIDIDDLDDEDIDEETLQKLKEKLGEISEEDEEIDSDLAEGPEGAEEEDDEEDEDEDNEESTEEVQGGEDESSEGDEEEEMEVDAALMKELQKRKPSGKDAAPVAKKPKVEEVKKEKSEPKKVAEKQETKSEPAKKTLPSGLVIEDHTVGSGPKAKKGKKVLPS
jgi:FK506-binding nuclear protein